MVLWREWKRSGGFWPEQMPDPEDPAFGEDEDGAKEFMYVSYASLESVVVSVRL